MASLARVSCGKITRLARAQMPPNSSGGSGDGNGAQATAASSLQDACLFSGPTDVRSSAWLGSAFPLTKLCDPSPEIGHRPAYECEPFHTARFSILRD